MFLFHPAGPDAPRIQHPVPDAPRIQHPVPAVWPRALKGEEAVGLKTQAQGPSWGNRLATARASPSGVPVMEANSDGWGLLRKDGKCFSEGQKLVKSRLRKMWVHHGTSCLEATPPGGTLVSQKPVEKAGVRKLWKSPGTLSHRGQDRILLSEVLKKQKALTMAKAQDFMETAPSLDLGKKVSVPQDLMVEELSLRSNRGSLLFQKRQRRVQRFTFEYATKHTQSSISEGRGSDLGTMLSAGPPAEVATANGPDGKENYRTEIQIYPIPPPGSERNSQELPPERAPSPSALASGYSKPLTGISPEKFNHTAIPKGYRSPWQEFIGYKDGFKDYQEDQLNHTPCPSDYRNFNKTPVPFGGPLISETFPKTDTLFIPKEHISGLDLLSYRPSFNRVAQGWVRSLLESEEL
ncbi:myozenin-3 [Sarcophilus harrisii]|uniref:myozenin-3 n=1 Tax=Sarcophilus harrisii TaxID=9305 RepID=UPI0013019DE4|nr:myozenin-3 [Sarcophilus harrisii]